MNNINALQREVTKIAQEVHAKWDAQQPHADLPTALFPMFRLFSEQEQARIEQSLSQMSSRVSFLADGQCDLRRITGDELDQLWQWQQLYDALVKDDQDAVQQHREALARA